MKLHQIMGLKVKEIDSFNSFMTKALTTEKPVHWFMILDLRHELLYKRYNEIRLQTEIAGGLQKVLCGMRSVVVIWKAKWRSMGRSFFIHALANHIPKIF